MKKIIIFILFFNLTGAYFWVSTVNHNSFMVCGTRDYVKKQLKTIEEENRKEFIKMIKQVVNNPVKASNDGWDIEQCKKALLILQNNMIDPEPVIVRASLIEYGTDSHSLSIFYVDEDIDTMDLVVYETTKSGNKLEERYPCFRDDRIIERGMFISCYDLSAKIRKTNLDRLDYKIWEEYLNKVQDLKNNWKAYSHRKNRPHIFIGNPAKVEVKVKVVDMRENSSNWIKVKH